MSQYTKWIGGLAEWTDDPPAGTAQAGTTAYISVVFTWQLAEAYQRAAWYRTLGYHVRAGGPAVILNPDYLTDVADEIHGQVNALPHHNPDATFTSRGCIRHCPFCAVPRIEGDLVELDHWEPKPVVCDNNLLACSRKHFDQVIDRLKPLHNVDFMSGLDARLLTKYHADRLVELDLTKVRLAWDDIHLESQVAAAIQILKKALIPKRMIKVYVLVGFNDTPEDALYRCRTLKKQWGVNPVVSRYQPLNALTFNSYVAPAWTDTELRNIVRYWWRTKWLGGIPFEEYKRDPATKPWLRRDTPTVKPRKQK